MLLFAKGKVLGGKGGNWHQPLSTRTHGKARSWETEKQANSHSMAANGTGQYELLMFLIPILGLIFNLSQ